LNGGKHFLDPIWFSDVIAVKNRYPIRPQAHMAQSAVSISPLPKVALAFQDLKWDIPSTPNTLCQGHGVIV
jgi:hypothetical protein